MSDMRDAGAYWMNRRFVTKLVRVASFCLALGLGAGTGVHIAQGQEIYRFNPEHRRPVDSTIHHLEEIASHNTYNGRERGRYDNAMRHLGQFEERLREGGGFDKDKLDQAIGDVQSVVDHNPMDGRAREFLVRDLRELRHLRSAYDHGYRFPY